MIIGATNRLDIVDSALLRPGRFDRVIEVPKPDTKGREHIFKIHTRKKPMGADVNFKQLVDLTENFTGAEIAAIANRAALAALKRHVSSNSRNVKDIKISQQDMIEAINKLKPNVVKEAIRCRKNFADSSSFVF